MLGTSARLLRLLSLFQGRRYWSGTELAERLEVTSRTLRRDVDKLRELGYPIQSTSGVEGGYQLGAGATMPPLLLDDDETVAVAIGLRWAASSTVEGVEEASVRALAKIERILPPRLASRVAALQTVVVAPARGAKSVDARTLSAVAAACRDCESLRFRYEDHSGKTSARRVDPLRLVYTGRRWYLVAWDSDRSDWRTFRMDRMQGRVALGARFTQREPPARDLAAYVSRGVWNAPPCRARIRLMASAEAVSAHLPSVATIEAVDEQSCIFEMGAATYASLAMQLVWMGVDFEVREPAELVEEVRRIGERFGKASGA